MPDRTRLWRHDWQVVRLLHDGAVIPVSNHRSMRVADAVAWVLDAWVTAANRSAGTPAWHYDVRLTPRRGSAAAYLFCIHCNADTTNPDTAVHDVNCRRARLAPAPLHPRWLDDSERPRCRDLTCPNFGDPDFGECTCPADHADPR